MRRRNRIWFARKPSVKKMTWSPSTARPIEVMLLPDAGRANSVDQLNIPYWTFGERGRLDEYR